MLDQDEMLQDCFQGAEEPYAEYRHADLISDGNSEIDAHVREAAI